MKKENLQQKEENIDDSVEGYSLFSHVRDIGLQRLNRAMAVVNIIEDNMTKQGLVNQAGMYLSMKYWNELPDGEKAEVYKLVSKELGQRKLLTGGEL